GASYPGDYSGPVSVSYSPDLDGDADPGEIVWGWIPFEEDHTQGKDRPSLVVGRDGGWVLALMLTSKDHVPGSVGEVREDRHARWMNIGSGKWDAQGRPSEIRLDRVIRLDPSSIRPEGAIMPRENFEHGVKNIADRASSHDRALRISGAGTEAVSLSSVSSSRRVSRRGRVKTPSDPMSSMWFPAEVIRSGRCALATVYH